MTDNVLFIRYMSQSNTIIDSVLTKLTFSSILARIFLILLVVKCHTVLKVIRFLTNEKANIIYSFYKLAKSSNLN